MREGEKERGEEDREEVRVVYVHTRKGDLFIGGVFSPPVDYYACIFTHAKEIRRGMMTSICCACRLSLAEELCAIRL